MAHVGSTGQRADDPATESRRELEDRGDVTDGGDGVGSAGPGAGGHGGGVLALADEDRLQGDTPEGGGLGGDALDHGRLVLDEAEPVGREGGGHLGQVVLLVLEDEDVAVDGGGETRAVDLGVFLKIFAVG